jgi:hypothetical protein
MILLAILLSKPEVGSSKIRRSGLFTTYTAIHSLFFSPPDIPLIYLPPT